MKTEDRSAYSDTASRGAAGKKICPSCGTANTETALFCGECGHNFQVPDACPSCGFPLGPGADVCERCGEWTGGRGCPFCGRDLPENAAHCPSCGNPRNGIPCPVCGALSRFDFCPSCNACLTEAGRLERERALAETGTGVMEGVDEAEDLKRLRSYLSGTHGPAARPLPERVFETNRDARRYCMARKPRLGTGWLCTADGRIHASPAACSHPKAGGRWLEAGR